jgi:hypothetical protein
MDDLLKKANIPDDKSMYIGELIGEPFLGKTTFRNDFSIAHYSLRARPLWSGGYKVTGGKGEIVLDSAERIPVRVIGSEHIIPTQEARRSGRWKIGDDDFMINDTDLTPEQARRARYFVQPLTEMGFKAPASNI